ncbi:MULTISPECIES: sugar-binding transcriptional regulator [unclassified Inquilinus]|uniref:sugar-binding transcriptional regulator n=1 Tax=unclassified Inquilinus TaxID=2645927 RepID=UPI003F900609
MTLQADLGHRVTSDAQREQFMVQAAKLYYDLDRNQSEIAQELGLTRWQVGRLLQEARETGIVRIEIVPRAQRRPDLESRLQARWGLREAIVVPGPASGDSIADEGIAIDAVAQAAGQYLAALTPRPALVGVSWGRTMTAVARRLPPRWNDGVQVVLMNGATNIRGTAFRTNAVAEGFAEAGNGSATLLPVPAIVGNPATRTVLEEDPVIAGILDIARKAPVACFGMGPMTTRSVLVDSGYLDAGEIAALQRAGAVGDVLGRFLDAQGRIVSPELDARTIGLRPEALRDKAYAIGVAAGAHKAGIARACLAARYINVLVTDAATAAQLLGGDAHA